MTLENSTLTLFDGMELETSTYSQAVSHAKTLAHLENKAAFQQDEADFGLKSLDCLAKYDQLSQSLRMLQICWLENQDHGLPQSYQTWPRSGTMRNGTVYKLPTLAYPMAEIGSGYWPTPMASDGFAWLRVSKSDPRGSIAKAINRGGQIRFGYFPMYLGYSPMQTADLSETMMGFPLGWTDLKDAETP